MQTNIKFGNNGFSKKTAELAVWIASELSRNMDDSNVNTDFVSILIVELMMPDGLYAHVTLEVDRSFGEPYKSLSDAKGTVLFQALCLADKDLKQKAIAFTRDFRTSLEDRFGKDWWLAEPRSAPKPAPLSPSEFAAYGTRLLSEQSA